VIASILLDSAASSIHASASAASTAAIERAVSSAVSPMAIWTPSPNRCTADAVRCAYRRP
jgi:hypothetical protein